MQDFPGYSLMSPQLCSEKGRTCSVLIPDSLQNNSGTEFLPGTSTEENNVKCKGLATSSSSYPPACAPSCQLTGSTPDSKVPAKNCLVQFCGVLFITEMENNFVMIWCQQQSCSHVRNWTEGQPQKLGADHTQDFPPITF